jgi:cell division protein FtsI (penicillin-binding protein 3)
MTKPHGSSKRPPVLITPGLSPRPKRKRSPHLAADGGVSKRSIAVTAVFLLLSSSIAAQLVHLAMKGQGLASIARSSAVAESFSRPDIVDRQGRLLATDVKMPSLYANPSRVIDRDVLVEKLQTVLADVDAQDLRERLADRSKKFIWVKRGLSPRQAQRIHNLGLPGLGFKKELRRAYPSGALIGHVLGTTDVDNRGLSGIERYIDAEVGVEPVTSAALSNRRPLRLSLDLGVQHAVEDELSKAQKRYAAKGAAAIIVNVDTSEIVASVSLPGINPIEPHHFLDEKRIDRVSASTYELGSIFKMMTVAMALDAGLVTAQSMVDVIKPLAEGRFIVRDSHGPNRPLSVTEILTRSSNVGAGKLALAAGPERHKKFLRDLGLMTTASTEAGPMAAPQLPERWQRIEQITIAFGHGLAVAPLQFAGAAAALMNGGIYRPSTYLVDQGRDPFVSEEAGRKVVAPDTSRILNVMLRQNVIDRHGTGKKANVPGYAVGGKTGTAEIASAGGYQKKKVISSFVSGFPMPAPQYLALVTLFEPEGTPAAKGKITASVNAAPTTARIVKRIAPLLNVFPGQPFAQLETK